MEAIFKTTAQDITFEYFEKIKSLFSKNSYVEFRFVEIDDETEYLLSSEENKKTLQKSIQQLKDNNLLKKTIEELEL
jgi:hypothetical protein